MTTGGYLGYSGHISKQPTRYTQMTTYTQALTEIDVHGMPLTLPVLQVVDYDMGNVVYAIVSGKEIIRAQHSAYLANPRKFQNVPALVLAPTDADLLRKWTLHRGIEAAANAADFCLIGCEDLRALHTEYFGNEVAEADPEEPVKAAKPAPATKKTAKVEVVKAAKVAFKEDYVSEVMIANSAKLRKLAKAAGIPTDTVNFRKASERDGLRDKLVAGFKAYEPVKVVNHKYNKETETRLTPEQAKARVMSKK